MTDSYHTEMAVVYAIKGSRGLIKIGRAVSAYIAEDLVAML
jgi:hypothetical protein